MTRRMYQTTRFRKELVTRRDYDFGGQPTYWYATEYDLLGRPTNATDSTSLAREWLYNRRSELSAASIGTNHYGYAYDTIGNRLWASANAATNTYSANCLNQYASILRASVSPCEPSYDLDGNMTGDGVFSYAYDAENRLVSVTSAGETNGAIRVLNAYDHRHRRIRKIVQRLSLSVSQPPAPPIQTREWQTIATHTFVWDGNLPVHETVQRSNGSTVERSYFWGMDKSGTEQGAGGVGGLLAVSVNGAFFIPCYDHNGNIVRYVSENGSAAAQYTYDPYGNTTEVTGPLADEFPFGFSTKYHDRETGFVSYLMRFYNPPDGRWLNRDPIEEQGGENLYEYCGNSPAHSIDALGMAKVCDYLCEAALRWSHHRFHLDYERYVQDSIIVSAWKKCYERIAPKSVKEGVETALARLNVRGVTVGEGTPLKATVSGDIFCNLSKSGHFPKRTMTVSSSHAWSVVLTGPWELKIYEESENVFGAAVGYKTQSFAHYLDFGLYAFSLMGLGQTVPNSYNAEDYVGHVYIDEEARSALNRYSNILALDSL